MKCLIVKFSAFLLLLPTLAIAGWQVAKPQAGMPTEPFFQAGTQQDTTFMAASQSSESFTPMPAPVVRKSSFTPAPPPPPHATFVPAYGNMSFPNRFANLGRPAAVYAISISGSLKENLEHIMDRYHWKVVWKAPFDYNFDGRINGSSLPNVIEKLLKPFPLQAKLYMSNHIMIVVPRNA